MSDGIRGDNPNGTEVAPNQPKLIVTDRISVDGDPEPRTELTVPIPVPPEVEQVARERLEELEQHPGYDSDGDRDDRLGDFLMDHIDLGWELLTDSVGESVEREDGRELDRPVFATLSTYHYGQVLTAVEESDRVDTVNEWVREAIFHHLHD